MVAKVLLGTLLAGLLGSAVAEIGARCASGFCENPSNCPRCDDGERCVTNPMMMCAGTCYGKCQAKGDATDGLGDGRLRPRHTAPTFPDPKCSAGATCDKRSFSCPMPRCRGPSSEEREKCELKQAPNPLVCSKNGQCCPKHMCPKWECKDAQGAADNEKDDPDMSSDPRVCLSNDDCCAGSCGHGRGGRMGAKRCILPTDGIGRTKKQGCDRKKEHKDDGSSDPAPAAKPHRHHKPKMCAGSPHQMCKMMCPPKECPEGQCFMRKGWCCDGACQAEDGKGKNDGDDDDKKMEKEKKDDPDISSDPRDCLSNDDCCAGFCGHGRGGRMGPKRCILPTDGIGRTKKQGCDRKKEHKEKKVDASQEPANSDALPEPANSAPVPAGKLLRAHPSIASALRAFNKCDTDKDGSLSKDEFSKCPELKYLDFKQCSRSFLITRVELEKCAAHHAFQTCDKDADGSLSAAEFAQCDELKKLGFRWCDKNHDGKVSEVELDKCVYEMDNGGNKHGHGNAFGKRIKEGAGKVVKGAVRGAKRGAKDENVEVLTS